MFHFLILENTCKLNVEVPISFDEENIKLHMT